MADHTPSSVDNGVLQNIAPNAGAHRDTEADDLALAKAMQEQERAFHWLSTQAQPAQPDTQRDAAPGHAGPGAETRQQEAQPQAHPSGQLSDGGEENTAPRQHDQHEGGAAPGSTVQQGSNGGGSAAADAAAAEGLSDAELALMLQHEEQQAHLLELAGYGGAGEGEYSEEDEEGYLSDDSVDPDEMTYEELQALGEAVGSVSRGLPPAVAAALPRRQYSQPRWHSGLDDEQCAVCREEYLQGQEVASLPCSHFYHPDCIAQWLQHQKVCPICSQEVKP